jgi:hypothetical protein
LVTHQAAFQLEARVRSSHQNLALLLLDELNRPEDQIPNLFRNPSPPCWFSDPGDQTPVETKACPVLPDHCLWRDQDQSFFPGGPELMGNDPEQFVEQIEPRPWMSTFQNGELLPQR